MSVQQTMLDKYATCKDLPAYDGKNMQINMQNFIKYQFVKMIRYFTAKYELGS